jgi:hypothetical protein
MLETQADACVRMASRLHRDGPRGSLELAFEARTRDIERAWRMHLDEILYRQPDSADEESPSDVMRRPDLDLDLDLDLTTDFSFDPTTPRRSAEHEEEEVDDHGGNSHRRDQPKREPRWRPDPGRERRHLGREELSPGEWVAGHPPPDSGTRTSRGPAARKSGTSKPRVRRSIEGIPLSSRIDWIISPSASLRAPVTRSRSPWANCGRTLRALSCASVIGSSSRVPA